MAPEVKAMVEQYGGWSVDLDAAAQILGFHRETVRKMHEAGQLPGHRGGASGRALAFFIPALMAWINDGGVAQYQQPVERPRPARLTERDCAEPDWVSEVLAA